LNVLQGGLGGWQVLGAMMTSLSSQCLNQLHCTTYDSYNAAPAHSYNATSEKAAMQRLNKLQRSTCISYNAGPQVMRAQPVRAQQLGTATVP